MENRRRQRKSRDHSQRLFDKGRFDGRERVRRELDAFGDPANGHECGHRSDRGPSDAVEGSSAHDVDQRKRDTDRDELGEFDAEIERSQRCPRGVSQTERLEEASKGQTMHQPEAACQSDFTVPGDRAPCVHGTGDDRESHQHLDGAGRGDHAPLGRQRDRQRMTDREGRSNDHDPLQARSGVISANPPLVSSDDRRRRKQQHKQEEQVICALEHMLEAEVDDAEDALARSGG